MAYELFGGILYRFRNNCDGIAAVEFALIVPLLLVLYLGTVEISGAITVNKNVARMASTVADLVTQQDEVDRTELQSIMDVGGAIMFPYTADKPEITVIGVDVDTDHPQGGKVVWSRRKTRTGYNSGISVGTDIRVPNQLRVDETFIVKVIATIEYKPIVTLVIGSKTNNGSTYTALDMSEEYWLRPRQGSEISCANC